MFNQFVALLADALAMLLLARCLLHYGRLNYMHPLAQFCCRSSDWLVKPLRRLLPPLGGLPPPPAADLLPLLPAADFPLPAAGFPALREACITVSSCCGAAWGAAGWAAVWAARRATRA